MRPNQDVSTGRESLDPRGLVDSARSLSGARDDELRHSTALEQLAFSLDEEGRLSPAGQRRARKSLVRSLVEQIETTRRVAEKPDLGRRRIRPVVVTGLLRTGTTFLQHLLAQHPGLRAPALWELMAPARRDPPEDLIAHCEAYVAEYDRLAPEFKNIHPLRAELPEECHRLTATTFHDPIFALRYHVPRYSEWLDGRSMVPAYRYHRTQLSVLLDRIPGGRILLKGPSHLWYLDDLAEVYPDALVIRLHRSPAVAVPSVCSLTSVVRGASSAAVDDREIGDYWLNRAASVLDGLHREDGPFRQPLLDVRYADLVGDPMKVVTRVCEAADLPLTEDVRERMDRHLAANRAPGGHAYRAERFGLSATALAGRFSGYIEEFAVPKEA
ncbi:sulfotransferase [Amycolatopsis sp. NPDC089917]|uniref:sulfotransferase family protein n=1 Tax=Amycolatopsis sp. NPDC089917 TaxID=3155187 RepID=UPI00343757CE